MSRLRILISLSLHQIRSAELCMDREPFDPLPSIPLILSFRDAHQNEIQRGIIRFPCLHQEQRSQ